MEVVSNKRLRGISNLLRLWGSQKQDFSPPPLPILSPHSALVFSPLNSPPSLPLSFALIYFSQPASMPVTSIITILDMGRDREAGRWCGEKGVCGGKQVLPTPPEKPRSSPITTT